MRKQSPDCEAIHTYYSYILVMRHSRCHEKLAKFAFDQKHFFEICLEKEKRRSLKGQLLLKNNSLDSRLEKRINVDSHYNCSGYLETQGQSYSSINQR